MSRKSIILASIIFGGFLLSGVLFYQGLKREFFVEPQAIKKNQTQQVLGEWERPGQQLPQQSSPEASQSVNENKVKVVRVIDGDTIEVLYNGQNQKLRYIGVDTPETVDPRRRVGCFGKEASDENKRLLEGKVVILEKDVSEMDKYGRLLRYVYLPLDDGTILFVNDYLVRQGFAQAYTYPPDVKYADRFVKAQQEARDNNRGLWGACKKQ